MRDEDLLAIDKNFLQIVNFPTRKEKTLDIVVTDIAHLLNDPEKLPPIKIDDNQSGVPSDHDGVRITPRNNWRERKREHQFKTI